MNYTLYYSRGACSLAVHMVLYYLNIKHEAVAVNLKDKTLEDKSSFTAIAPLGYVPVLKLPEGRVMTEVGVLLFYLAEQVPEKKLLGVDRWNTLQWVTFISTELHKGFSPLFNPVITDEQKLTFVKRLEDRLMYVENNFHGHFLQESLTIADFYLFTVLRWAEFVNVSLTATPKLTAFIAHMKTLPAVQSALQKERLK